MAAHNVIQQEGTDGSTYRQRVREAGYRAWNDGLLVMQTIWAGLGGAENAVSWFREQPDQWEVFVDPRYREVGVGHAVDEQGVRYFVIVFGVRPAVLPIFINDGAEATDSPVVAVRLTNENAVPLGEGTWMGKAIEVRLSNSPDFEGQAWQPWESLLPWTLEGTEPGTYAVYAEYRDGAGRTAVGEDTIRLTAPGESSVPTSGGPEETAAPAVPPITTPEAPQPAPTAAETPVPVDPVEPATETPIDASPVEEPTPLPRPTGEPDEAVPTWTPLPPEGTLAVAEDGSGPDWPLILVLILQGGAWLLGLALFLRRR
jgi:hypothetical protein